MHICIYTSKIGAPSIVINIMKDSQGNDWEKLKFSYILSLQVMVTLSAPISIYLI
jgi:hypothetical protein